MLSRRHGFAFGLALLLAASPALRAAEPKWPVGRTTPPETVEDLKALETAVGAVVTKVSPATVGIIVRITDEKSEAGSGVIVSADGLILTAGHISGDPGRECEIRFPNGKTVKGKALGRNDKVDSGMIRITDKPPKDGKWPTVEVVKSADVAKNQWVVTLGHPGGYRPTRPPVARLGRVLSNDKTRMQTDCTIVGGDSGGPLFDLEGRLIGIHSRIGWSLTENVHVPTDAFKKDWDEMLAGGEVGQPKKPSKAILGVEFDEDAPAARLANVLDEGPAEKAGLKGGDVITKFDGQAVATADAVRAIIFKHKPGDEVPVVVTRADKTLTFTVKLAARSP